MNDSLKKPESTTVTLPGKPLWWAIGVSVLLIWFLPLLAIGLIIGFVAGRMMGRMR